MLYIIFFICFSLIAIAAIWGYIKFNKKSRDNYKKVVEFNEKFSALKNSYIRTSEKERLKKDYASVYEYFNTKSNKIVFQRDVEFQKFSVTFLNIDKEVEEANKEFVKNELINNKELFDNIDGRSLDEQQRKAVVVNEDNNLIVAGAGSGKTLTISAKVKYLVEKKNIKSDEILLISFTKKAADEMTERISKKLGIGIESMTFHKLGLNIISRYRAQRPEVCEADELGRIINKYFTEVIYKDPEQIRNLILYFAMYMNIPKNLEEVKSLGEVIQENKRLKLETMKDIYEKYLNGDKDKVKYEEELTKKDDEYEKEKGELYKIIKKIDNLDYELGIDKEDIQFFRKLGIYEEEIGPLVQQKEIILNNIKKIEKELKEIKRTLNGEQVKSVEELIIANFLFLNGVSYIYENPYEIENEDKLKKAYKPDFYLPDYRIYIEHFGINKDYKTPWLSKIEEEKYIEGITWKRDYHKKNGTKLIETYSYYNQKGILIDELRKKLIENGVILKEVNYEKVYDAILKSTNEEYFQQFKNLISTFIGLFKSRGFKLGKFENIQKEIRKIDNKFERERSSMFINIVKPIYKLYEENLEANKKVDFNDMINQATKIVKNKNLDFKYKYIIIDEFQDISEGRFRLIKEIQNKTNAVIIGVGDDWQSIYRFTGSDINLFTKFEKYFGKSEILKIEKTYRNSQQLINVSGNFIMKNSSQIKKKLKSDIKEEDPIVIVKYNREQKGHNSFIRCLINTIERIVSEFGIESGITILGRNNRDIDDFLFNKQDKKNPYFHKKQTRNEMYIVMKGYESLKIKYMTVHKSKGLEDDNIILINLVNNQYGFPNQLADDPVLKYVLIEQEDYDFAEERRLFYVALTRTKNKVYLLTDGENESIFCEEIEKDFKLKKYETKEIKKISSAPKCPKCKKGYLIKRKNGRYDFLGCSNFPSCDFTVSDVEILDNQIICPSCHGYMVKRHGEHGAFYGCSNFPKCKKTMNISK